MKIKGLVVIGLSTLALAACGGEKDATSSATTPAENTNSVVVESSGKPKSGYYFENGEVVIRDLKIKITDHKVIQPGETGNEHGDTPVIAFWYDTTNLTDKEIDPTIAWAVVFKAIQDNNPNSVNELEVGGLPDNQFLNTQLENIKKDGTVSNAISYKLDDNTTPVTLVARQGVAGDKIGEQIFEIK